MKDGRIKFLSLFLTKLFTNTCKYDIINIQGNTNKLIGVIHMKRKRFIKLAMAQGCNKRVATFAANQALLVEGNYQKAWDNMDGIISGRFEIYVNPQD